MSRTLALSIARLLGLGLVANGIFMLVSPASWYFAVPGVITTGPFNQHFLRDIGLIFLLIGTAFLLGAARPGARSLLWSTATFWPGEGVRRLVARGAAIEQEPLELPG